MQSSTNYLASVEWLASRRKRLTPVSSKPPKAFHSSTQQAADRPKRQFHITGYVAAKRQKHDMISVTSRSFAAKPGAIASLNAITARGQWLEETHIDHVQALLSTSHPAVDGLQPSCLFEPSGCQFIGTPNGPFVQILNLAGNHWICLSNVGCNAGHINVLYSANTR